MSDVALPKDITDSFTNMNPFLRWKDELTDSFGSVWCIRFPASLLTVPKFDFFLIFESRYYFENWQSPLSIPGIIGRIKHLNSPVPLRPSLSTEECDERIIALLKACWDETPERRPKFSFVKRALGDASPDGWISFCVQHHFCLLIHQEKVLILMVNMLSSVT